MASVTIHLDTAEFAKLLERVAKGEEVVLDWQGKSVARLVADSARTLPRKPGRLKGKISLDETFFDPLPEEELAAWGQ
jgi:antitoxin (DNA-binding transcriptional repressor) of toxin-antitoxin stability system